MRDIDVLKRLESIDKAYFTTLDLERLFPSEKKGFTTFLKRLVDDEILVRLAKGVYMVRGRNWDLERIANQLYYPSYLSFVTVLGRGGILNQIPYSLTFATTRKSKRITLGGTDVVYSQLKPELYFGYDMKQGINIAEPEKALLDQLYLISLGKASLDFEELNLIDLDKKKFLSYAAKFPGRIKKGLREIKKRWGTISVTIK
jgi:predicted transcriptional regulator of viral defense system